MLPIQLSRYNLEQKTAWVQAGSDDRKKYQLSAWLVII